jgi:hypothetical protein
MGGEIPPLIINNRVMGLDMYLMQRIRKEEHIEDTDIELVYWRKANAIHKFFTDINDQYDSCESIEVTKDMLGMLLDRCTMVLEDRSRADELLPTTSGFFFGSTQYDEWYFKKLEDTIRDITPILSDGDIKDGDLYYYGWY